MLSTSSRTSALVFDDSDWSPPSDPHKLLYRAPSVGSWGVTSIGRGFDWDEEKNEPINLEEEARRQPKIQKPTALKFDPHLPLRPSSPTSTSCPNPDRRPTRGLGRRVLWAAQASLRLIGRRQARPPKRAAAPPPPAPTGTRRSDRIANAAKAVPSNVEVEASAPAKPVKRQSAKAAGKTKAAGKKK
ncbi:hypothetical protein NMY22_g2091 [Coprinellus aureogranulatus]|nr:hypothetical protein NMY22_g2091 [Coprinellus aureogranulatus]